MTSLVEQENFTNLTFVGDDLIFEAESVSSNFFLRLTLKYVVCTSFCIGGNRNSCGYRQRIFCLKR